MNLDTSSTILNDETEIFEETNVENVEIPVEIDRKTGVSFPIKLSDGKELKAIGLRKKNVFGLSLKIYSFAIYADNQVLVGVVKSSEHPSKTTEEMYKAVIDSAVGITVRMVIVFRHLTMVMVRKYFNEGLGAGIRKLGGAKSNDLTKRILGEATDDIKLTPGSEIEITCLPGYVMETKVCGKAVNKFESELLCRAFIYMYLGDDPLDKEAKEKFGMTLLSLS
ncbi:hypothetical protein LXL04_006097 [Taraxacum kok-saghyz]